MVRDDHAQLRAQNDALNAQVDSALAAYEEQTQQLAGLKDRLGAIRAEGRSADELVRMTANASGIPVDVWISPEAFTKSTPEKLAAAVADAARAAARSAQEQSAAAVAPITGAVDAMPDISQLIPGAPDIRDLFDSFIPAPAERVSGTVARPERVEHVAEDPEGRPTSWLKDGW